MSLGQLMNFRKISFQLLFLFNSLLHWRHRGASIKYEKINFKIFKIKKARIKRMLHLVKIIFKNMFSEIFLIIILWKSLISSCPWRNWWKDLRIFIKIGTRYDILKPLTVQNFIFEVHFPTSPEFRIFWAILMSSYYGEFRIINISKWNIIQRNSNREPIQKSISLKHKIRFGENQDLIFIL